jgi:hypothetical protein
MKTLIASIVATASLALAGIAFAQSIETPVGTLTVDPDNGYVLADGASGNPDPGDGWASVSAADGQACADDNGTPGDYDEDGVPDSEETDPAQQGSPTCGP